MLRINSGLVGAIRIPGTLSAPGIWSLEEQVVNKRAGNWPGTQDLYYSSVILLLQMDGSNGSTTFTDTSSYNRTVTPFGTAAISTNQSVFGSSSALFNGNGAYLTSPASSDWNLSDNNVNVTIEFFMYKTADKQCTLVSADGGAWRVKNEASGTVSLQGPSNQSRETTTTYPLNTWLHVAVVRLGGIFTIYVGGVAGVSGTLTPQNTNSAVLYIGRNPLAGNTWDYPGYLDSLRITKGVARYSSNFTPPALPFPNG